MSGGKFWTVQYESLSHNDPANPDDPDRVDLTNKLFVTADQAVVFNFDQLASGANLFGVVGNTTTALVVIGEDITLDAAGKYIPNQTDDIKTSQGGDGATIGVDSQMFDPGEGAYFTYVTGTDVLGVGDNANSINTTGRKRSRVRPSASRRHKATPWRQPRSRPMTWTMRPKASLSSTRGGRATPCPSLRSAYSMRRAS